MSSQSRVVNRQQGMSPSPLSDPFCLSTPLPLSSFLNLHFLFFCPFILPYSYFCHAPVKPISCLPPCICESWAPWNSQLRVQSHACFIRTTILSSWVRYCLHWIRIIPRSRIENAVVLHVLLCGAFAYVCTDQTVAYTVFSQGWDIQVRKPQEPIERQHLCPCVFSIVYLPSPLSPHPQFLMLCI